MVILDKGELFLGGWGCGVFAQGFEGKAKRVCSKYSLNLRQVTYNKTL